MNLKIEANIIRYALALIAEKNLNPKCGIFGNELINLFLGLLLELKRHTLVSPT